MARASTTVNPPHKLGFLATLRTDGWWLEPLGSRTADPYQMYLADLFTIPVNLYGGPAISVPCGLSEGLPVGFQIMAPTMADDRMRRVAAALESVIPPLTPPQL